MTKHDTTRRPTGPDPADYEEHLYQARHATMSRRMLTKIATKLLDKNLYNKAYNPSFSLNKAATWYKPKNVAYLYKLLRRQGLNTSTGDFKNDTGRPDVEVLTDKLSDSLTVTDMNALRDYFAALSKYNANAKYNKNHTAAHRRAINARAVKKYRAKQQARAAQQTAGAKENLINNLTNQNATTLTDQQKQVQKEQAEKLKKAQQERVAADAKQKQEREQANSEKHQNRLYNIANRAIQDESIVDLEGVNPMGLPLFERAVDGTHEVNHFYVAMLKTTGNDREKLYRRVLATAKRTRTELEQQQVPTYKPVLLSDMVINNQIQDPSNFEAFYGRGRAAQRLYYARLTEMLVLLDERGEQK